MEATPCKVCCFRKEQLKFALKNFRVACVQISHLNRHYAEVSRRYVAAKTAANVTFRYHHRLRMSTIEGIREMYIEYAIYLADVVASIRMSMVGNDTADDSDIGDAIQ